MTAGSEGVVALKPCPFCGSEARYGIVEEGGEANPDFGGHFVQCTNPVCYGCMGLRFACGDDPRPALLDAWNTRAALADQRDERGGEGSQDHIARDDECPGCDGAGSFMDVRCTECRGSGLRAAPSTPVTPTDTRGGESALRGALEDLVADVENGWGDPHTLRHARAALASPAAPGGVLPDGWVAVPETLTKAMLDAARDEYVRGEGSLWDDVWSAAFGGVGRMNRAEHLLTCLSEECDEVGQRIAKALRFGLREIQAGQPLTNDDRICDELRDLISVAHILHGEGVIGWFMPERLDVDAKRRRIERFMAIGREQGVLTDTPARQDSEQPAKGESA